MQCNHAKGHLLCKGPFTHTISITVKLLALCQWKRTIWRAKWVQNSFPLWNGLFHWHNVNNLIAMETVHVNGPLIYTFHRIMDATTNRRPDDKTQRFLVFQVPMSKRLQGGESEELSAVVGGSYRSGERALACQGARGGKSGCRNGWEF